ncbi:MAG: DUF59 domain-containing protein [Myxococcales bacterium]|nr:DUF59 domain-containing protein [Myxococcales bacterium]
MVSAGRVSGIEIEGGEVTVVLTLDGFDRDARHAIEDAVLGALRGQPGSTTC